MQLSGISCSQMWMQRWSICCVNALQAGMPCQHPFEFVRAGAEFIVIFLVTRNLTGCCMALKVPDLLMRSNIGWASQDLGMGASGLQLPLCIFKLLLAA